MKKWLFLAGICCTWGCASSTFKGTVNGVPLEVADAIFGEIFAPHDQPVAVVFMSDKPGLCDDLNNHTVESVSVLFELQLTSINAQGALGLPQLGSFTVANPAGVSPPANVAGAAFLRLNGACTPDPKLSENASSGSANLEAFSLKEGGSARGNFNLAFGTDKVTGVFDAPYCDFSADVRTCN